MMASEPELSHKAEVYKLGDLRVEIRRRADGMLETVSFGSYSTRLDKTQIKALKKLAEKGVLPELRGVR